MWNYAFIEKLTKRAGFSLFALKKNNFKYKVNQVENNYVF